MNIYWFFYKIMSFYEIVVAKSMQEAWEILLKKEQRIYKEKLITSFDIKAKYILKNTTSIEEESGSVAIISFPADSSIGFIVYNKPQK